ncbi:HIT domain-containing protein [archaeon]|jgi:histidine triad (HIT) family protein|nr:HIT domain-containing protein [archaeon]MBT3450461.1 HIT domain-containing protein [archaeon]MBT6868982.1 HIT domain-containing protein [archaeon]MBT7193248.1 HIT domain-containing protein [archaeon]MBT7380103.1 HIT domain-containing protein [archaeon]
MNITPEMKAQLEEQKKQCVFCKIIKGEIPPKKVYEDKVTMAMLDINPILKGHTIFLPKEHYPIMPYIPANEFKHFFGITAQLTTSIKKAMVTTGMNIFVANGGVAGQQAPHFLIHFLPREKGDGFFNFLFKKKHQTSEKSKSMIANNLPIMMKNHFGRNPANWHKGIGEIPNFLKSIKENSTIVYEDEKTLAVIDENCVAEGHIEIYSKEEEKYFEKLDIESASHLFYVASFAATAVFEGLGAHGTNIILKSGESDDNPEGKLCVHILPRKQDDNLKSINWQPKQPDYDLDSIASKIKDKTWNVKFEEKKESVKSEPKVQTPIAIQNATSINKTDSKTVKPKTAEEEIQRAIGRFQKIKK